MDENNLDPSRHPPSRPKRSDSSRTGGSPRSRSSRATPLNMARAPPFIDDATINAMITSGMLDTLGPMNFAQFRVPVRQASDIVNHNIESFGQPVDFSLGWIPKNINLSSLVNQQAKGPQSSRFNKSDPTISQLIEEEDEPPKKDPRFLLPQLIMEEQTSPSGRKATQETQESILQWFDRSVEKELKKRKESLPDSPTLFADIIPAVADLNLPKGFMEKMSEASASRIEIATQMRMEPDTELTDAVDKFAKAEAMCAFAGAVKAAEAAAEAAPPELAEEAAVASARGFQTEIHTSEIREEISGEKPMEVIGYIDIVSEGDSDDEGNYDAVSSLQELVEAKKGVSDTKSSDAIDMESWVIVTYSTKKTLKRSVGRVIEVLDDNIGVTFLKMKGEYFVWPDVQDIDTINKDDVLQILPSPREGRRGELYFSVKFDGLNVQ
ncbi:hypothetical protein JTB14_024546 [Gonioctena quinquepunctata]|nr:hypothetical protein JTB14_024546 [Gonioctena quinquepunctata]